jgi:hypothetical protein
MSDEMSGAAEAASTDRDVYPSASALALGLGLILGGAVVLLSVSAFAAMAGEAVFLLAFIGIATTVIGVVQFVIGVYQFADNIDRAAKALINGQRG